MPLCTPTSTEALAGELAGGDDFLHQRVDVGPVDRGACAGEERHQIEVPDVQVAAPGDIGNSQYGKATQKIEQHAEVTAVHAVDEYATEKRNDEAGERDDDDLPTNGHG